MSLEDEYELAGEVTHMKRCVDCRYFDSDFPKLARELVMDRDVGKCLYFQKEAILTPLWAKPAGVGVLYGKACPVFEDKLDTPEFPPKSSSMALKEHRLWGRVVKTERRLEVLENDLEALRGLVIPVR